MSDREELSRRAFLFSMVAVLSAACSSDPSATTAFSTPAPISSAPTPTPDGADPVASPDPSPAPTSAPDPTAVPEPTAVPDPTPVPIGPYPFALGVASGDPDHESVIIWTRLTSDPLGDDPFSDEPVQVLWEISLDDSFGEVIASGIDDALPQLGHSLHVSAPLPADTWAYYRFTANGHRSDVGRSRTFPAPGSPAPPLRFAFSSCQNFEQGHYAAHRQLAAMGDDIDAFVFLGDYIYEYGPTAEPFDADRVHASGEVENLGGYRNRYAQYRLDPHLQAHHRTRPWIVTWDDHEVDNDHAGDISQDGDDPAAFSGRRAAAYQAWYEHMPVRLDPPQSADWRIYRDIVWGDLARFYVMDGRQYRDDQATDGAFVPVPLLAETDTPNAVVRAIGPTALDPDHSLFGSEQEQWLLNKAGAATEQWQLLSQQVMMHGVSILPGQSPAVTPLDTWDGYTGNRARLLATLTETIDTNLVVLSGDFHAATAAELRADPFDPSLPVIASEFMAPAISSRGIDLPSAFLDLLLALNPQVKHFDGRNGFLVCEVTPEDFTARYHAVLDVTDPDSDVVEMAAFRVEAGSPAVSPA